MEINWKQLYADLDYNRQGSWRDLGRELNLSPALFSRLKSGKALSARNFLTVACWLGDPMTHVYDR